MLNQLSYIAPVAAVDKNENYCNTRRSSKTVKDFNSFGRVGRKRKPRNQNRRPPPPSKSLINSLKRLSGPEICKKQQDLQLSMNLTRVFVFYNPPPPAPTPKVENQDSPQNHLKCFLERKGKR